MKISINSNIIEGPWGGGNQAVKNIYNQLVINGHDVITNLKASNIDLILMIHPSRYLRIRNYGIDEIKNYLLLHPNTVLVHRVNTSGDIHRGGGNESDFILESNRLSDFTVFISDYLKRLYISKGFDTNRPHQIILNGADEGLFYSQGRAKVNPSGKLRIITHHWSNNYMKGFDIYERLDLLLETKPYCDLFEFIIIGNVPKFLKLNKTQVIDSLSGNELSQAIKENHIYLTASRNEGAGMHHIEGMQCGLPVLFLNSGALPEYCSPYGIEFTLINFEQKLLEMYEKYNNLRQKVLSCPYTGTWMAEQYLSLFKELVDSRRKNPISNPGLRTLLRQRLMIEPLRKANRVRTLIRKVREYLR